MFASPSIDRTPPAPARSSIAAYWIVTAILATECIVGGALGVLRLSPFLDTATRLGYPDYFNSILGVLYVAAGFVLLAPRLVRLKEWAYAGLVFNYTGAAASHIWVGDGVETLVGPAIFLGLTVASWALRPPARRELPVAPDNTSRVRVIVYWFATLVLAAELTVGGMWDLLRIDFVRDVLEHLGYPMYLLTILAVWKLPGAVVILLPRLPRLKEWVYAGAAINFGAAAASHVIVGDGIGEIVSPIVLLAVTVTSWALRPGGRRS